MSIRTRRLRRDHEKIIAELSHSEFCSVKVMEGDPPDHYQVTYSVSGLKWDQSQAAPEPLTEHVVDIFLPLGYPKQSPRCTMRTPIWHPNIGDYVCIGDYWSAGVTLVDIIAHVADMIQYKSYNLKSPVNKPGAQWAERNIKSFPLGTRSILPPENGDPDAPVVDIEPAGSGLDITLGPIRERQG